MGQVNVSHTHVPRQGENLREIAPALLQRARALHAARENNGKAGDEDGENGRAVARAEPEHGQHQPGDGRRAQQHRRILG